MPNVAQQARADKLEDHSAIQDGVVLARDRAEADHIIAARIAAGTFDTRFGALVVPPDDDSIEAWEARQHPPVKPEDDPPE